MGFGESAIPVKFYPKSIITINEVETPSWTTINTVSTPAGLQGALDAIPVVTYFTSVIPLFPFITEVITPLRSPTAEMYFSSVKR